MAAAESSIASETPIAAETTGQPLHYRHWPRNVPYSIPPAETTLWDNLEITVRRYPNKSALTFLGHQITYSELKRQTETLCGWLQQKAGVEHGDRVILMMQNCSQFVIAYYAILRAGAVVVPVNPMTRAAELPHYVQDSGAKVAICTADVAEQIFLTQETLDSSGQLKSVVVSRYTDCMGDDDIPSGTAQAVRSGAIKLPEQWSSWLYADPELPGYASAWHDVLGANIEPAPYRGAPDDLVALGYTSGTTGHPKGCMHTHRTIGHNVFGGAIWNGITAADECFGVTPMFHITGMLYGMHSPIYSGANCVILPRWDRDLAGRMISKYRVTNWINIPTMMIDLLASPNLPEFDLSSLRHIGGGGAAMPAPVAKRLEEEYGLFYREGYGLTETAAPSHSNPPQRTKRACLGIPVIGTESKVIDPETLQEVPQGEIGEIIIRGPQVFKGYWDNPQATAEAFMELDGKSWFRSGDLGRIDEDGYFFITDRLKRMINASGFKVWPAEVEGMLFQHPDIQEACIISVRDPYRGETVKAMIVLRGDCSSSPTGEDIVVWAREKMAAYKVPRVVEFVDSLPKSGSGKVMWRQLQEQEQQKGAEGVSSGQKN
nr:long chain fatty acid CoA ligase [uncultured bacterium]